MIYSKDRFVVQSDGNHLNTGSFFCHTRLKINLKKYQDFKSKNDAKNVRVLASLHPLFKKAAGF